MKKIYFMLLLTFFASCSDDSTAPDVPLTNAIPRLTGNFPENGLNPYENAGILVSEITDAYLKNPSNAANTVGKILEIEDFSFSHPDFLALNTRNYLSPDARRIDEIANGGVDTAHLVISNAPLSVKGALSLSSFVDTVFDMKDNKISYDELYTYVVSYEVEVISDPGYSGLDRQIILTTSSVARHGFFYSSEKKKRPRDRDWDISWGNIVAAIEGSQESIAKTVVMSVSTGAVVNK